MADSVGEMRAKALNPNTPGTAGNRKQARAFGIRFWPAMLACVTLVLLAVASVQAFSLLRAASLLYGMSTVPAPFIIKVYSKIFKHDPVTTDLTIQARSGPLKIRMLTPRDLPNAPIIILVHGFAPQGNREGLLNILAVRLSRSGLRVVMPDILSEELRRMNPTAVDEVDDVIRWSALTSGERVSLFGISFSGGMVISAAAKPGYADYVKMVFCLAGYNSIDRLGRYYLHDPVRRPDGQPYSETPPPGALSPMALQYLDELVPANSVKPMTQPLQLILDGMTPEQAAQTAHLTPEQQVLLDDLLSVKTKEMRERYHALLERHRVELAAISPMGKINDVHSVVYVLHGYVDTTIPRGEAEWTQAEASQKTNVKVLITSWLHHAILTLHAPTREKLRVGRFVSQMLDAALRPSPLPNAKR